jgi:hypothetical protein
MESARTDYEIIKWSAMEVADSAIIAVPKGVSSAAVLNVSYQLIFSPVLSKPRLRATKPGYRKLNVGPPKAHGPFRGSSG